ncbi:MAG TPA: hypothetical protein VFA18_11965 [Gemmataceae bacterium]|nr:hypothetical protein [Gemmataceae bacterium]
MLRALCLLLAFSVFPMPTVSADTAPDLGANAALKYWQAFATMPTMTEAEQNRLNANCLTMPLDAQARKLVDSAAYSLRMMHRGAALRHCNWGIGTEEGIYLLLPHERATRVLSSLACLRARLRFEQGQSAKAVDDLVADITLARHASLDGSLIAVLVGYATEARATELLARYLPKLDAEAAKSLKTRLAALPAGATPAQAMKFEENAADVWLIHKAKETKDKESLLKLMGSLVTSEKENRATRDKKAQEFLDACGGTADSVVRFAEQLRPSYARMAKMLELPLDQTESAWKREAKAEAGNPLFPVLSPVIPKVRQSQALADVRRALLLAAIDVQIGGQATLKDHPDPIGRGPFEYAAFNGGFELRSKWPGPGDKPVSLTVGQRGQ